MEAIERGLRVSWIRPRSPCAWTTLPIHVFNMADERNMESRIVGGERVGAIVDSRK